jgi:broad specificity phosphatase PhoE
MRIFLIRHGETTGDIEDRYGGDYDDHLTEKGKEQARELAKKLADKGIEVIFSSPRFRAKETADILGKTLRCNVIIREEIRERNSYGFLTGMKKSEARIKYPKETRLLKSYKNTIKDAENYEHFRDRIVRAFEEITESENEVIAIVTHGGPISCIFREILKKGEFKRLDDCAFFEIEKNDELNLLHIYNAELAQ